jgi:hypothetical protein
MQRFVEEGGIDALRFHEAVAKDGGAGGIED